MFITLDQILTPLGLYKPNLSALTQDAALYNCLLFQPGEGIAYGDDYIRMANQQRAIAKFTFFFRMAAEQHSALAITPEYSCPTSVIPILIVNDILPNENGIWIIGGESIKANDLQQLIYNHANISWIVEEDLITDNLGNDFFFNPVYHIFKTRTRSDNALQTVIVVQFKTHHLGGVELHWERNHFIPGTRIYLFENRTLACRMLTINCADIFNPAIQLTNLERYTTIPYLIIHIQLNTAPNNIFYRAYRGIAYGMGNSNKEIICLNWARKLRMGQQNEWNQYGGSGIYMQVAKPKKVDTSDLRLINNELKGLYYTKWAERYADAYFFNYDEHVFEFRKEKTSQEDAPPQVRSRSGPEMINAYTWNNETNEWEIKYPVSPGFDLDCAALNVLGNFENIKAICTANPVDAERLVYLANGKALEKDWYLPEKLLFFQIEDSEIPSRITFTQNPDEAMGHVRKQLLFNFGKLEYKIITRPKNFPNVISDLANNCRVSYRQPHNENSYHLNLYPIGDSGVPATGVYIGEKTIEDAQDIFNKMLELYKTNEDGKRVVVWYYSPEGQLERECFSSKARITDNTSQSTRSIKRKIKV